MVRSVAWVPVKGGGRETRTSPGCLIMGICTNRGGGVRPGDPFDRAAVVGGGGPGERVRRWFAAPGDLVPHTTGGVVTVRPRGDDGHPPGRCGKRCSPGSGVDRGDQQIPRYGAGGFTADHGGAGAGGGGFVGVCDGHAHRPPGSVQRNRPALLLFLDVAFQAVADDPGDGPVLGRRDPLEGFTEVGATRSARRDS